MRISDWSSDVCSSDLQFKEELSILDAAMAKGALTTENHRRAVEALRHEFTGLAEAMRAAVNVETVAGPSIENRSEEHTSELQSLMRISYAVFCLKKKKESHTQSYNQHTEST